MSAKALMKRVMASLGVGGMVLLSSACIYGDAPFPSTWLSRQYEGGRIAIEPDGTALLEKVPVLPTGARCQPINVVFVTEEASWSQVGNAQYVIKTSEGESFVGPDTQGLGSLNWSKLGVSPCGRDKADAIYYIFDMDEESWERRYGTPAG